MYYNYIIRGISITYDKYIGKMESNFSMIFPKGTTEEKARENLQKMKKDAKHYKNLSLFRQVYIHYESEEERIL